MWKFGPLWAGDVASYDLALNAVAQAMTLQTGATEPQSDLLSIEQGVGIIKIDGGLIPGNAGFMSYFGLVGYDDIRGAAIEAATNPDVKSILLDINSGGGAVSGCADCASLLAQVGKLKPVVTYSGGSMGSAAYWIGSQGETVLVGPTAQVGSIGVILKHSEASKMRAAAGITDTVIRSGDHKQLANSLEPLTAEAKAGLQQMSDDINSVFVGAVATARGVTAAQVDSGMGGGREFIGKRAVKVGLADAIATYEGAISVARALQSVDNTLPTRQNAAQRTGANMALTKKTLSAEVIAAIASGAVVEASAAQETAETTANDAAAAAATAAAAAAAETPDPAAVAAAAAAAAAAATAAAAASTDATAAAAAAVTAEGELVKFLRSEIVTKDATILANGIELARLNADAAMTKDTQPKLLEIARTAVDKMKIALGGSAGAAATMTAVEVIAAHAETSKVFGEKFVVGGAAATSAATTPPAGRADNVSPLFRAVSRSGNSSK